MNAIRIVSCILAITLGLTVHGSLAAAQPATVSCGTAIDGYFNDTGVSWLDIIGGRVTARGGLGFSSFTMADGYQLYANPLGTLGASTRSVFNAWKGSSHFTGPFHEVFPGRGNTDVDRWDFWASRYGTFWLRSITWGGTWGQLQGVTCYRGPQNQTIVTGYSHVAGYGTDFWTFVLKGSTLI